MLARRVAIATIAHAGISHTLISDDILMIMSAAEQIARARHAAGLTQQELAARSGVRQPNIAAYENGRRHPSEAMLTRLLEAARPRPSVLLDRFRDEILRLAAHNKAYDVRVFGSIARGEDTPESDIDLLVSFELGASLLDQAGLIADLEDLLGRHVDVVSDRALTDRDARIRAELVAL